MKINISDIEIGNDRREIDKNIVDEIADSVKEIGLLNAVTVSKNRNGYKLIAGAHRINAFKKLEKSSIPANVIENDNLRLELAEIDENLVRSGGHYSDLDDWYAKRKDIYEALYPQTKAGVAGGKASGHSRRTESDSDFVQKDSFTKDTSKKTGKSETTVKESVRRSKNIIPEGKPILKEKDIPKYQANEIAREDPEEQEKIFSSINTGEAKDYKDYKKQEKKKQRKEKIQQQKQSLKDIPLPERSYSIIYADPPWKYDFAETDNRKIENHYPTMTMQELYYLGVPADDDCILYLWATAPKVPEAIKLIESWGFDYKTCAVWDKQKIGMGYWFRGQHELLFVATKGNISPPDAGNRVSSVISQKRSNHSEKPDKVYDIINNAFPNHSKVELFARKEREGWDSWGNQI